MTISDCHIGHCIIRRIWARAGEVSLRGECRKMQSTGPSTMQGNQVLKSNINPDKKKETKE
jgi:hypothetical protein